jgi:membrane associated rhomboid family serine protease
MIPIGDDNRGKHRPPVVVIILILINVAVFVYQLTLDSSGAAGPACEVMVAEGRTGQGTELECFVYRYGARAYELTHMEDIAPAIGITIFATIFTSMFMHGGWLHIGGNMLYLWIFGDNVEDAMGHLRFLIFYLLTGVGAVGLQVAVDRNALVPMVGASGAIAGVLAAYLVLFPHGRVRVLVFLGFFVTVLALPALIVIGFWILLQFFSGFASLGPETRGTDGGVAYFAHIGGFLAGLALVFLFRDSRALARIRRARSWD